DTLPPPLPGHTRFVCISDTHSREPAIPPGDVLIHAGDLTRHGRPEEIQQAVKWLKTLPHPVKIIIAGNHDVGVSFRFCRIHSPYTRIYSFDENDTPSVRLKHFLRDQREFGICYLENQALSFESPSGRLWKVYGTPASPLYGSSAFQYDGDAAARAVFDAIPAETEILLTHGPPYGTLDVTRKGFRAGCRVLSARLRELPYCRLHVFGHIHEASGVKVIKDRGHSSRVSINAAMTSWNSKVVVTDLKD
ncbi:Metallo-dependent phosphatase, partial [Fistulina hepatica ATCC 64428]